MWSGKFNKFGRIMRKLGDNFLKSCEIFRNLLQNSRKSYKFSAGAHLAFLPSYNTVAFLQEDDDICI